VTYAPQNPYIGEDRFRVIQRKGHPLKLSLFSFVLGQHERTLEWLAPPPQVGSWGPVPALLDAYRFCPRGRPRSASTATPRRYLLRRVRTTPTQPAAVLRLGRSSYIPVRPVPLASPSLIKTTVPAGATTGKVEVVTPSGTLSSNARFRVLP
jgi:hypothetical protein